jgi:thymidylate synthase ThyX
MFRVVTRKKIANYKTNNRIVKMFQPSAQIIADSVNTNGDRLTTFVLKFHRFILPEVNTHRMISKSVSSSRALSISKMIQRVIDEEVYPLHWGKNEKGMIANHEIDDQTKINCVNAWDLAKASAIQSARVMDAEGLHKQVVNRLLEPFSTTTMIATATNQPSSWANLFKQRCHPNAQPEFKALADKMREAYELSEPHEIPAGRYHIPFIDFEDMNIVKIISGDNVDDIYNNMIKISVGRCARVSYLNHDGKRDIKADIALHDRLLSSTPAHLSPFEHIASALPNGEKRANFVGWESYRYQIENK